MGAGGRGARGHHWPAGWTGGCDARGPSLSPREPLCACGPRGAGGDSVALGRCRGVTFGGVWSPHLDSVRSVSVVDHKLVGCVRVGLYVYCVRM